MVDPCGIIGVIAVAAQITKVLVELRLDWKDAPSDVRSFLRELQVLKTTLSESNSNIALNPDFISAFEGRHSAVLSQLGSDAPDSDSRVMVDACQAELNELLVELKKRLLGHRVSWERIKGVFLARRTRDAVEKLQRQCQILNGLVAIDSVALSALALTEARGVRQEQRDKEAADRRDKVLDWLTPLGYATLQNDYAGLRRPGTGRWLLESKEYCAWRDAGEGAPVLFCPGIPGAGKTIIASMIIEDLQSYYGDDEAVCVAYVYCNFRRHDEQTPKGLLSSLLKQIAQGRAALPSAIESLYDNHYYRRTEPSLAELGEALTSVIGLYERVYVVVDALDESPYDQRDAFLEAIAEVQRDSNVSVLATSRPEVLSHFTEFFEAYDMKEIRAVDGDILNYVNGRLANVRRPRLSKFPDLLEKIRTKLVEAAGGMYAVQR